MKKLLFLGVAALVLSACSNEVEELQSSKVEYAKTIKAEVAPFTTNDGTRTTVVLNGSSWNTVWAVGDKMGIWPKTGLAAEQTPQQIQFTINESQAGQAFATFSGTGWGMVTNGQYSYYAYYPYSAETSATEASFTYTDGIFQEANNQPSSKLGVNDFAYAPAVVPENPEDAQFMFNHLGALICFKITVPEVVRDKKYFYAEITAENNIFPTKVTYNPSEEVTEGNLPTLTNEEYTNKLTIGLNNLTPDEEGKIYAYFLVLPAAVNGQELTIKLYGEDGVVCTGTKTPSKNWASNDYINHNVTTTADAFEGVYLCSEGTANCYIVNPESTKYIFRADIKGNGVVPSGVDDVAETGVARADGAVVLWETVNTQSVPAVGTIVKNANLFGNCIQIETPETFTAGNALVSLYKDGEGGTAGQYDAEYDEILWSWHIWATDADIEGNAQTYGGATFMDRNLGAINTTPVLTGSKGLLYQWGRPFPIKGGYYMVSHPNNESQLTYTTNNSNWNLFEPTTAEVGSLKYSAQHPMTVVHATSANPKNWYWGAHPKLWRVDIKTMYDPCPVGWKVPKYDYWKSLDLTDKYDTEKRGLWLEIDGQEIYYPTTGLVRNASNAPIYYTVTYLAYCSTTCATDMAYIPEVYLLYKYGTLTRLPRDNGGAVRACKE